MHTIYESSILLKTAALAATAAHKTIPLLLIYICIYVYIYRLYTYIHIYVYIIWIKWRRRARSTQHPNQKNVGFNPTPKTVQIKNLGWVRSLLSTPQSEHSLYIRTQGQHVWKFHNTSWIRAYLRNINPGCGKRSALYKDPRSIGHLGTPYVFLWIRWWQGVGFNPTSKTIGKNMGLNPTSIGVGFNPTPKTVGKNPTSIAVTEYSQDWLGI